MGSSVERLAGLALLQLTGELHALGLAAGERGRRLAQADVAEAHVEERLQLALDAGMFSKKCRASSTVMSSTSEMFLPR